MLADRMARNNNAQITYCSFSPPVPTTKFYTCYKKEVCCQQGCCIIGPYQVYQVWYYWLLFLIILGIISGASWLCKKPRAVTCRTPSRNSPTFSRNSYCSHSECSRRRCGVNFSNNEQRECNRCESNGTDFEDNIILDRLFVSFRNRNTLGDPPSYSSILSQDYKNKTASKLCPLYSYYGPPPTYSSMYRSPSDSSQTQQATTTENVPHHSSAGTTTNVIQIQVHNEDRGSQSMINSNRENGLANTASTDHPELPTTDRMTVFANDDSVNITSRDVGSIIERNHEASSSADTQLQSGTAAEDV